MGILFIKCQNEGPDLQEDNQEISGRHKRSGFPLSAHLFRQLCHVFSKRWQEWRVVGNCRRAWGCQTVGAVFPPARAAGGSWWWQVWRGVTPMWGPPHCAQLRAALPLEHLVAQGWLVPHSSHQPQLWGLGKLLPASGGSCFSGHLQTMLSFGRKHCSLPPVESGPLPKVEKPKPAQQEWPRVVFPAYGLDHAAREG